MKIKKTPTRKLPPVPPELQKLIDTIANAETTQLVGLLQPWKEWKYPRGDLFHWIPVLNKFDLVLEKVCADYGLSEASCSVQTGELAPDDVAMVTELLRFSRFLLENCTNRNIYNSVEHVNNLLKTSNVDVLLLALRLLHRLAQRMQRPSRSNLFVRHAHVSTIAQSWNNKEAGQLPFVELCKENFQLTAEMKSLQYNFFRVVKPDQDALASKQPSDMKTPTPAEKQRGKKEGAVHVHMANVVDDERSEREIYESLVAKYSVPEEAKFGLFHAVRIARRLDLVEERRKLVMCRLLAITIYCISEDDASLQNLMIREPNLTNRVCQLIQPHAEVPQDVQTVAVFVLDTFARHRSDLGDVLTALNASANHGPILYVLRHTAAGLADNSVEYSADFLEALYGLINFLISTVGGGNMLISAGVVPVIVSFLSTPSDAYYKITAKLIVVLDSLLYSFPNAVTAFTNANGIHELVRRVELDVDACVAFVEGEEPTAEGRAAMDTEEARQTKDSPIERVSVLKSMFRLILHMMQVSGTADRMRNLVESSFPKSLYKIISHPRVFGNTIYGSSIYIMASIVHNEPTSLSILQESQLPQKFMEVVCKDIPNNHDVLQAIPNAFEPYV